MNKTEAKQIAQNFILDEINMIPEKINLDYPYYGISNMTELEKKELIVEVYEQKRRIMKLFNITKGES